ncbi:MAG: hypothetical protein M3176_00255 [Chloroflexota bacterium]|nr:hypothetical protein [Chloroflexota bacterium]
MLETVRRPAVVTTILEKRPRVEIARLVYPVSVGAAVALGTYIRAARTFAHDFPLNDGGLFFTMVQDLQRAHYQLPAVTSYNAANIPFTYSPFGLYVAALVNDITRISLTNLFRFLPFLVVTATMLAFFLLARSVLKSKPAVLAALLAFALIPRSFIWLIMGGGMTRAFGFLFALLALYTVHEMYEREEVGLVFPTALFSGLTILSHIETGKFLAYTMVIFFVCYGAHRTGVIHAALVAAGTAIIVAPWLITVVAYHGLAPFQAANQTGSSIFTGPADRQNIRNMIHVFGLGTNEPYFWLLGGFGLLGALVLVVRSLASVQRREYILPALPIWWLVIVLLDNRAANTFTTIPVALCAGVGIAEMVIPALNRAMGELPDGRQIALSLDGASEWRRMGASVVRHWPATLVCGFLIWYAAWGAMTTSANVSGDLPALTSLTRDERDAMQWVAHETPAGSRFLVVSGKGIWPSDDESEWFPTLSNRISLATPQGYEWTPDRMFQIQIWKHDQLQSCTWQDSTCIDRWSIITGDSFDYVYVRNTEGVYPIASSLTADYRYDLVYNGPGAMIFARH